MPLRDSTDLRNLLGVLLPGLVIDGVPAPSGQRVVYFCHFNPTENTGANLASFGDVVLKVSEGISAQAIAYIQREIEILNKLDNAGYPKLLFNQVFTENPITEEKFPYRIFVTIENRVDAKPLSELIKEYNTESAVSELLFKIINVLRYLWDGKPPLIHRDLKPENILITPNHDVVIIDLGIIREEGVDGVTLTLNNFGPCTPKYASPEQAINDKRNISFKSDIFTLGTLCYELLSGKNPFADENDLFDQILHKIIRHDPPSLYECGLCSSLFSDLIEKMMEKHPYKRYRKIDDLVVDLETIRGTQ